MKKNEQILRERWNIIKHANIYIMGIPEGEEREKGEEIILEELIDEHVPNLLRNNVHIQEA